MEEFKGDKRSKEYKKWKKKHSESNKGWGDSVEKVLEKTGVKKVVEFIAGEDCGCDERKDKLNHLFPYYRPECFTEEEFNYLSDKVDNLKTVTPEVQQELIKIYNRVFHQNAETTNCGVCFANGVWAKLQRAYKEYL